MGQGLGLMRFTKNVDGLLSEMYRFWYRTHVRERIPDLSCSGYGNVLVFAPHPDDEAIGALGAICRHVSGGDQVCIVFCRTGNDPHECATRRAEALRASECLGVRYRFLDWSAEDLINQERACQDIRRMLSQENPALIYLPSPVDPQPEHIALNELLSGIMNMTAFGDSVQIRLYGVLAPIPAMIATGSVGLEREWSLKRHILYDVYRSQTTVLDFRNVLIVQRMLGTHSRSHAAELYFELPIERWERMTRAVICLGGESIVGNGKSFFSWKRPLAKFGSVASAYSRVLEVVSHED